VPITLSFRGTFFNSHCYKKTPNAATRARQKPYLVYYHMFKNRSNHVKDKQGALRERVVFFVDQMANAGRSEGFKGSQVGRFRRNRHFFVPA
jgi:hypothetical protein